MKTLDEAAFDFGYWEGRANGLRQAMVTANYMLVYNDVTKAFKAQLEREYNRALRLLDDAIMADIQAKRSTR